MNLRAAFAFALTSGLLSGGMSPGTIAYFHGNFIPRRDPRFDLTHPVDGSNPDAASL